MSELKPCPFCGENSPLTYSLLPNHKHWYITCDCCGMMYQSPTSQRKYVKLSWNTRPIEDELTARIAELEEKQRWIPVSERLPDNWESVLTIDISKSTRDMVTAFYDPETSLWSTHFPYDLWVTHWMPLPEPPIVYGKVCEE